MKKGDRVEIRKDAKYNGQEMEWLEEYTGKIILRAGTMVYHNSYTKLNAFSSKITCFSFKYQSKYEYIYCLVVKSDIVVDRYDYDECRIDLATYCNDVDIYYAGIGKRERYLDEKGHHCSRCISKILKQFDNNNVVAYDEVTI